MKFSEILVLDAGYKEILYWVPILLASFFGFPNQILVFRISFPNPSLPKQIFVFRMNSSEKILHDALHNGRFLEIRPCG